MRSFKDVSVASINAGFVTVLVGFASSAVIIFQAAQALGATPEMVGSWMLALGVGMGVTCIGLSLRFKAPIATAWSTSGAAMLITSASGVTMNEAMGAFIVTGLLIAISGFTGWFERAINHIPLPIASGMLAGVLLRFGVDAFASLKTQFALVLVMFFTYLVARRLLPRYAVILALVAGTLVAGARGMLHLETVHLELAHPVFVMPRLTVAAVLGIALPLFVVTMASQNVPAVAVLRTSGYPVPVSPLIGWTGVATTVLAPFGAFALNLATITAAICTSPDAHKDPDKRYTAAVAAGVFYAIVGLFGATVGAVFAAFPKELVLALAGFALLGTIANALTGAMSVEGEREPALIAFLVTASGVSVFGIGAAFWGVVAGVVALVILRARLGGRKRDALTAPSARTETETAAVPTDA